MSSSRREDASREASGPDEKPPLWCILWLLIALILGLWLRCHTIAPSVVASTGLRIWPVVGAADEPLDCDEAFYAYMGRRMVHGDVLYRDLTENKPPLGYWIYALSVWIGGASETTVRLLSAPFALATIFLCWDCARRIAGPFAAVLAAVSYAVVQTDPYVFGNGSNLEHFMNFFSTAALDCLLAARARGRVSSIFGGVWLACAILVKPVAATNGIVALWDVLFNRRLRRAARTPLPARLAELSLFCLGGAIVSSAALAILYFQHALADGYEDCIVYARALAESLPAEAYQPSSWVRWLTGNAAPSNRLPWPFGLSTDLVWWGAGLYPVWTASLPVAGLLLFSRVEGKRLLALWYLSAWVQVVSPRLYWQHYYMLLLPPLAISFAVSLVDAKALFWKSIGERGWFRLLPSLFWQFGLLLAASLTILIQWQEYVSSTPERIVVDLKGGGQWLALRDLGRDIDQAKRVWSRPKLLLWGWQSPLYIYANIDSATRHGFADPLLKAMAAGDARAKSAPEWVQSLARKRLEEIVRDVNAKRPELVFAGDVPFPGLQKILLERYKPYRTAPDGRGLWIERTHAAEFKLRLGQARRKRLHGEGEL